MISAPFTVVHLPPVPPPQSFSFLLLDTKLPTSRVLFLSSLFGSIHPSVYPCINILSHSSLIICFDD